MENYEKIKEVLSSDNTVLRKYCLIWPLLSMEDLKKVLVVTIDPKYKGYTKALEVITEIVR